MIIKSNRQSWEILASRWADSASLIDLLQDALSHEAARAIEIIERLGAQESLEAGYTQADLDGLVDAKNAFVAFCNDIHDEISERIQVPFERDMALILEKTRKANADRFVLDGVSLDDLLGQASGQMTGIWDLDSPVVLGEDSQNDLENDSASTVPLVSPQALVERDMFCGRLAKAAGSVNMLVQNMFPKPVPTGWILLAPKEREALVQHFWGRVGTIMQKAFGCPDDFVLPELPSLELELDLELGISNLERDVESSLASMLARLLGQLFRTCAAGSQEFDLILPSLPEAEWAFVKAACDGIVGS